MPPRKTPASIIAAKTVVHALALTPLAILAWQFWDVYSTNSDALGADPVAEIEHRLGLWALRLQFTTENPGEIDKILMDYQGRAAFDAGSYTRGLYSRGVE